MPELPETIDRETVRKELLALYHGREEDGFLESALGTVTDPIRPVDQRQRRRFHPTLVLGLVVAAMVVAAAVYFTCIR
jgi:hypothetical protein